MNESDPGFARRIAANGGGRASRHLEPRRSFANGAAHEPRGLLSEVSERGFLREGTRLRRVRGAREAHAGKERRACLVGPRRSFASRAFRLLCLAALISLGAARTAPAEHEAGHTGSGGLAETAPAISRLLELGSGIGIGTSGQDEFLDPDVAFVLSAAAAGPDVIEARWEIEEGYYLYRDKFRFRVADTTGASLGEAGFPAGEMKDDEYFGPMEVYYGSVAALVPVGARGRLRHRRRRRHLPGLRGRGAVLPADHQDRLAAAARGVGGHRRRFGHRGRGALRSLGAGGAGADTPTGRASRPAAPPAMDRGRCAARPRGRPPPPACRAFPVRARRILSASSCRSRIGSPRPWCRAIAGSSSSRCSGPGCSSPLPPACCRWCPS